VSSRDALQSGSCCGLERIHQKEKILRRKKKK